MKLACFFNGSFQIQLMESDFKKPGKM